MTETTEAVPLNIRLVKRAYWLMQLRWFAAVILAIATFVSSRFLHISLQQKQLYVLAVVLLIYNAVMYVVMGRLQRGQDVERRRILTIINIQISTDLLILAIVLHYSGGIENPIVFYFVFHMVISSILLPVRQSFMQATYAVLLFGLVVLLEYREIIPHYCLDGFVVRCLHKDGTHVLGTFLVFATAMYLMVYMASYVAARLRRAEQSCRGANELLSRKDRIKDEYVMRLTHDIKGDLAAIQTCLEVVIRNLRGKIDDGPAEFVNRAHSRTQKVTKFVRTLLRLTHMRLNDEMEVEPFDFNESIQAALESVSIRAEEAGIALHTEIQPNLGRITGDQFSIEEMMSNLLLNAVKYTPQGGKVTFKASTKADDVLLEVTDTGIGIPKKEASRIFEEFFRTSNARKLVKDGTGLGLAICKQIVESHAGRIWFASEQGKGTTFWVRLPRNEADSRPIPADRRSLQ